jgi:hypothetical protein
MSFLVFLTDELSQLSLSYQGLDLLLQGIAIFGGVTMVAVEATVEVFRSLRWV